MDGLSDASTPLITFDILINTSWHLIFFQILFVARAGRIMKSFNRFILYIWWINGNTDKKVINNLINLIMTFLNIHVTHEYLPWPPRKPGFGHVL